MTRRISLSSIAGLAAVLLALGCHRVAEPGDVTSHDTDQDGGSDTDADLPPPEDCYQGDLQVYADSMEGIEQLKTYPCITGNLDLTFYVTEPVEIPDLIWVGGFLGIQDSEILESLSLSGLKTIGDGFELTGHFELHTLDLGSLESVGGWLSIWANYALTDLDLTSLESVGSYMDIAYNSELPDLDGLSSLTTVGDDIAVIDNGSLPCCDICDMVDQLVGYDDYFEAADNLTDFCCPGDEIDCP
jgi:hypothetical protein